MMKTFELIFKSGALLFLGVMLLIQCQSKEMKEPITTEEVKKQLPEWITKDFVMGKFEPGSDSLFSRVDIKYADREGLFLHRDTYQNFIEMWNAADSAGIRLIIRSATRNFDYQKGIWERKWFGEQRLSDGTLATEIEDLAARARKILLYSSMPGSSRHHWGTDLDLNSFNNEYFQAGEGLKIYHWLSTNAVKYGFCQPYTSKENGRTGYEEEKWHWSYMPISSLLTEYCRRHLVNEDITGFAGSEVADSVGVGQNYILGIDSNCL